MISIIIVNYNWKRWLQRCLDSLMTQTYKNFEIIFVDNNSSDDSVDFVQWNFPKIKIVKSDNNLGFAWWNNLGISHAQGDLIVLINNDTRVEKDFLERYQQIYTDHDYDILGVTEKKYDGSGFWYTPVPKIDFFWHPVYITSTSTNIESNLFYVSWVCCMFKKQFYYDTWWLDSDFFMYHEETDRVRRCRLYWHKIWQITDLFVYHKLSWSTWSWIKYKTFLWRNQNTLQMLFKNYTWYNLLWVLPIYITINILEMIFFLLIWKPKISRSYIKWWVCNIKLLPKTIKKRIIIQKSRLITDKQIMSYMYFWFAKLQHILKFYKRWYDR